jgi:hypothetical protein
MLNGIRTMVFLWIAYLFSCAIPIARLAYRGRIESENWYPWKTFAWWRIRADVTIVFLQVEDRTKLFRFLVVRWRFDRVQQPRWQQPVGGPRWLRRAWCLILHWPHFRKIADTLAGRAGETQQEITVYGCAMCQLTWWRQYATVEDPDGGDERDRVDPGLPTPRGGSAKR